jgi:peptidyl-prolyl cis-trans isomerase SurA
MRHWFAAAVAVAVIGAAAGLAAQGTQGGSTGSAQAGAAAPPAAQAPKSTILQKIIVRVNGEIFTQTELEFRQIQSLRDQDRQVRKTQDLQSDPGLRAALAQITPGILVDAVDELIVVQHGRDVLRLKYNDTQFNQSLEDLKKANNLDDKTFPEALKQEGMTLADLRVNFERAWFIQAVQQRELMRNMTLTEEEARQYYNAHQDQFMKPATVTLREIAINVPADKSGGQVSFSVSADESTRAKIAAVRDRALKGEDFAKLVDEVSESATKASGGLIGPVDTADISQALAEILAKMQPGDITEPLRTKAGYQILKMESRSASEPETFEKSKDQISQKILESRLDVERAKFLQKLLTQAVIEWKDDAYRQMYETERAARQKTSIKDVK